MSWGLGPLAIGAPLGLLALTALPMVLAIHWFRRRAPPTKVTALFLYPPPSRDLVSGRRPERLLSSASLIAELLACLVGAWWLADVHLANDQRGQHVLIVLDDRLRLRAATSDSSADRLKRAIDQRLATLQGRDRVTLIRSGTIPTVFAGPLADVTTARQALTTWNPAAAWHELDTGVALMQQLAAASGSGELWIASDRIPKSIPAGIGVIARGEAKPTSGLAAVHWLRDAAGERLSVRIYHSGSPMPRSLVVRSAEREIARVTPNPEAATLIPLTWADEREHDLDIALDGADPLPQDDHVQVLRPAQRRVKIALNLPEKTALPFTKVLNKAPDIEQTTLLPDLLIGDGTALPDTWQLRVVPGSETASLGPFLMRSGHPLCLDLDGTGALWVGGTARQTLPADAQVLIAAGNQVLLSEQRAARARQITLHTDPARGTLTQHPLWPALISNLIEARRQSLPGMVDPNCAAERTATAVLPRGATEAVLQGPDTQVRLFADADGRVLLPALQHAGSWVMHPNVGPDLRLMALALDARLGDLQGAETADVAAASASDGTRERHRSLAELVIPLVLIGVLIAGAVVLHARGR